MDFGFGSLDMVFGFIIILSIGLCFPKGMVTPNYGYLSF